MATRKKTSKADPDTSLAPALTSALPETAAPMADAPKPAPRPKAKKAAKTDAAAKPAKVEDPPVETASAPKPVKAKKSPKPPKAAETSVKAVKAKAKPAKADKPNSLKPESKTPAGAKTAQVLESTVAFEGPLFRVFRDHIIEPGGQQSYRDVIRHNGSVVILAVDRGKNKKDPWIVIERQYRHAAGQFLWELPAGKLDAGEKPIDGARRELAEETGYSAKEWTPLVEYYASPGFLGEAMKVFLAEGLIAGDAHPEEDERIDFRLVRLSELLELVDKGKIIDGKTLTSVLLYARRLGLKRKK